MSSSNERSPGGGNTSRLFWPGALALAVLAAAGVAVAHDPSKHRTPPTRGVISAVTRESVTVKTSGGKSTFTLAPETRIFRSEKAAKASDLVPGVDVAVFSTKLPDGTTAATEVNVLPNDATGQSGRGGHGHE